MPYPRSQRARNFKIQRYVGTDIATTNTWAPLSGVTDMVLEAQAGDVIEVAPCLLWASPGASIWGALDVATVVGSGLVSYLSSGTATQGSNGVVGWYAYSPASANVSSAGPAWLALTAGDISGGLVTLRWLGRSSTAFSILASGANHALFSAKNLGPAQPN